MNIKEDLFYIFLNAKGKYDLYEKMIVYIENVIEDTKGRENATFYKHVLNLLDSINNAGCDKRKEEQIEYLWDIEAQILEKYENYLY